VQENASGVGGWLWKGISKLLGAEVRGPIGLYKTLDREYIYLWTLYIRTLTSPLQQEQSDKTQPPKNAAILSALPHQMCWNTVVESIKTSELTKTEIELRNDKNITAVRNVRTLAAHLASNFTSQLL
jgi:hypothetical protein